MINRTPGERPFKPPTQPKINATVVLGGGQDAKVLMFQALKGRELAGREYTADMLRLGIPGPAWGRPRTGVPAKSFVDGLSLNM
jgi:hypothetical protein